MTHMDIKVREATMLDVGAVCIHLMNMHETTSYKTTNVDVVKMSKSLMEFVELEGVCFFILESEGEVEGFFLGVAMEQRWGHTMQSSDPLLYISPALRNNGAAPLLVNAYTEWALSMGVQSDQIRLGITTDVNVEKTAALYNSLGYDDGGKLFKFKG